MPTRRNFPAMPNLPRRRFIRGLAAGGILLGLSPWLSPARAQYAAGTITGSAKVLSGTEFDLTIAETPVNFTGSPRLATTINGSIPAPTLRWREGDTVTIRVTNRLAEETSIHWHGILLPYQMDGVPGISFNGIAPGETFVYRFKVQQTGTYWYHSHSIRPAPIRSAPIATTWCSCPTGPMKIRCGYSTSSRCKATTTTSINRRRLNSFAMYPTTAFRLPWPSDACGSRCA